MDEKIAVCRKKIDELEVLARLVYERWFVEFEYPDADGRPYKSNGGKMVWNDELKRMIPAEWESRSIFDCGMFHRGVAYSKKDEIDKTAFDAIAVFRGNNISDGHIIQDSNEVFISRKLVDETQMLRCGNVLIAMSSGSKEHVGKIGLVTSETTPRAFGAFCSCFEPQKHLRRIVYNYFASSSYREYIQRVCSGTGINNLKAEHFKVASLAIPSRSHILEAFNAIEEPIFTTISILEQEATDCENARDWLLPMLMNGQVEVAG